MGIGVIQKGTESLSAALRGIDKLRADYLAYTPPESKIEMVFGFFLR